MSDKVDKAIQKIKQISKDMIKEWRPDDWEPLDCEKCQCRESRCETWCTLYRTYEDAADAMLSALLKWLEERCTNHVSYEIYDANKHWIENTKGGQMTRGYRHRKDCPQCMTELKESGL